MTTSAVPRPAPVARYNRTAMVLHLARRVASSHQYRRRPQRGQRGGTGSASDHRTMHKSIGLTRARSGHLAYPLAPFAPAAAVAGSLSQDREVRRSRRPSRPLCRDVPAAVHPAYLHDSAWKGAADASDPPLWPDPNSRVSASSRPWPPGDERTSARLFSSAGTSGSATFSTAWSPCISLASPNTTRSTAKRNFSACFRPATDARTKRRRRSAHDDVYPESRLAEWASLGRSVNFVLHRQTWER